LHRQIKALYGGTVITLYGLVVSTPYYLAVQFSNAEPTAQYMEFLSEYPLIFLEQLGHS